MSNNWEKHEGILLQAVPYLENHRILKIFTPEAGLQSLIARYAKKRPSVTTPFCKAEWIYRKTQGDLYSLKDATLLDPLLALRGSYEILIGAGSIANDLLRSQFPQKNAQGLYELLLAYLHHLPKSPLAAAQSFRLKLLQFEGLLHLQEECVRCGEPASELSQGESVCAKHAHPSALPFNPEEWRQILTLGLVRRFSQLEEIKLSPLFQEKTALLFKERIHH